MLTVVAKLFGLVRPDVAVFGEKDYQQLALIRRMVADLCMGVDVVGADIVREHDGLALSSRNRYLDEDQRWRATALSRTLFAARDAAKYGADAALDAARHELRHARGVDLDYLELTDPDLGPAPETGPARLLIAARVGSTRLIDNVALTLERRRPERSTPMLRTMMKSKIHRATVTQADLHYVGSVTVDEDLLEAADLLPGELVHIVDVTNGARLETYTIAGERGSGVLGINGAAARLVHPGDVVILIAYGQMETAEAKDFQPSVVFVDADNKIAGTGHDPAEALPGSDLVRGDLHASPRRDLVGRVDSLPRMTLRSGPRPTLRAGEPGWTTDADVVVVGSGIAGLTAALRLRHQVGKVLVVTKDVLSAGSTQWAQGGIAAALGPGTPPTSTSATPSSPGPAPATRRRCACWSTRVPRRSAS